MHACCLQCSYGPALRHSHHRCHCWFTVAKCFDNLNCHTTEGMTLYMHTHFSWMLSILKNHSCSSLQRSRSWQTSDKLLTSRQHTAMYKLLQLATVKRLYFVGYIFRKLACKMWFAKVIFAILGLSIHGMAQTDDFRWINFAIEMKIVKHAKFTAREI